MELTTLQSLYVEGLRDLYSVEQQILRALPKMIRAATDAQLRAAFTTHLDQSEGHVERLDRIFAQMGVKSAGKKCKGMEGIIEEGADLMSEKPEPEILDAGLISAAQRVEHYEMAGYGTAKAYAAMLGYDEHVTLLDQTLDEEKQTDEDLSMLAESSINLTAMESGAAVDQDERSSGKRPGNGREGEARA